VRGGGLTSKINKVELPCDGDAIVRGGGDMNNQNGMGTRGMFVEIGRSRGSGVGRHEGQEQEEMMEN
jgi:hypothetical protein